MDVLPVLNDFPKITFGIIVLNGEPFTKYCLRSLYPFAYEIIVVEGCSEKARKIATPDGHSTDCTLKSLEEFKQYEDPQNKVRVILRDGFWSEKDEQSQAYAKVATGDYLWQVDIDEFYKPEDMMYVLSMLKNNPGITAVSFKMLSFWGGLDYRVDSYSLRKGAEIFHRLFKFGEDYAYVTHRPPTVHDPEGRCLRQLWWVDGYELEKRTMYLYHYFFVFPKQVLDKCEYYSHHGWEQCKAILEWEDSNLLNIKNPYRLYITHTGLGWLERYKGTHPPEIYKLLKDIEEGRVKLALRPTEDIEQLLEKRSYRFGTFVHRSLGFLYSRMRLLALKIFK